MTTISEAITIIKKAENDADKLIKDIKEKSLQKIEESRLKSKKIIEKTKEESLIEVENMLFEAETNAKKEALHISNKVAEKIEINKRIALNKVDEASNLIVKSIL